MNKIYFSLSFIFIFLFVNILSFIIIYLVIEQNIYNKDKYLKFKSGFLKGEKKSLYPHPYFGFSYKRDFPSDLEFANSEPLFSEKPNLVPKNPIKILILGGSVAEDFSRNDSDDEFIEKKFIYNEIDIFEKVLNNKFQTNRFIVYNASIGGGKQPQQLFKLYYLYFLGEKFDVVINLDGFNEIALPFSENIPLRNYLSYPRNYSRIVEKFSSDFKCIKKSNEKILSYNIFPIIELYKLYIIRKCHFNIAGKPKNKNSKFSTVTNFEDQSIDKNILDIFKIWKSSSEQIESFSSLEKFDYIHVLQPSHYLKGSKNLSKKEKNEFLSYSKYGDPISKYYNLLDLDDVKIKNKLDLRYIFKNNDETIYRDFCCHLTNQGMFILADSIVNHFEVIFKNKITSN